MTFRSESCVVLAAGAVVALAACTEEKPIAPALPGCPTGVTTAVSLAAGAYLSVDPTTDSGCVVFPGNGTGDTVAYLVIGQSAGGTPGDSTSFEISSAQATAAAIAPLAAARLPELRGLTGRAGARGPLARRFEQGLRMRERAALRSRAPAPAAAGPIPRTITPPVVGNVRTFQVCADYNCDTFKSVVAQARAVGADVAIYVDTAAPAGGFDSAGYDSLEQAFDAHVFTVDTTAFGGVSDVDSNGVVIVLMTNTINQLVSSAECESGGYVAGFFFPGDLDPAARTQYNDGELFYTIVPDPGGLLSCPHLTSDLEAILPSTFAHELQHMISFNQHVLLRGGAEEDLWLDESLSSLGEELSARSYLPDTASFVNGIFGDLYDAYYYYLAPPDHFLLQTADTVLPDFGAGWLYVRYLVDQFGAGLTRSLEQTTLTGTGNVAAQTGVPFATLSARWALANYVSDLPGFTPAPELQYTSWSFRNVYGSLYQQDPYDFPVAFPLQPTVSGPGSVGVRGELGAGSAAYVGVVQSPHSNGFSLVFRANATALITTDVVPRLTILRIR